MERVWLVSYGLAVLLIAAQCLTLVAMLSVVGSIHRKQSREVHALITDDGPDIHAVMPPFEGWDMTGHRIRSEDLKGGEVALLFLQEQCAPCEHLARILHATQRSLIYCPEFLIVLEATPARSQNWVRRHRLSITVITDELASIRTRLGVVRVPYGFLLDAEGVVRMKGVVNTRGQLEGLIARRGHYTGGGGWQTLEADSSA